MSSKNTIVVGILFLLIGLAGGYLLKPTQVSLSDYEQLESEKQALEAEAASLNSENNRLTNTISNLEVRVENNENARTEYNELLEEWNTLVEEWNLLVADWDELVVDYEEVSANYNRAYLYEYNWKNYIDGEVDPIQIPDTELVEKWLVWNEIDDFAYHDNFKCADFSILLSYYGRKSFWNMGVIGIHGYDVDTKERFDHALNVLNTTEGIVYIEPQLDELWWYDEHQEMYANQTWTINNQDIFIESIEIMADY